MTVIDDKVDYFFRGSPRIIIEQVAAVAFLKRESLGKKGCQYSHIRSCLIGIGRCFADGLNANFSTSSIKKNKNTKALTIYSVMF